jgi:hypothetical protein
MTEPSTPSHDLAEVQAKVKVGFVHYRTQALHDAAELELSRVDVDQCMLALCPADFHKTMPALNPKWKDCWQDVYRPLYAGFQLYVKFQLFPNVRVHIVSFKRKRKDDSNDD